MRVFSQKRPLVKAEIDTTNIRIGEQFNLKISVNEIKNVIIPKLELKGLEVLICKNATPLKIVLLKNMLSPVLIVGLFTFRNNKSLLKTKRS